MLDSNLAVGVTTKDTITILPKRNTVALPVTDTEPCCTPKQLLAGNVCLLWDMELRRGAHNDLPIRYLSINNMLYYYPIILNH